LRVTSGRSKGGERERGEHPVSIFSLRIVAPFELNGHNSTETQLEKFIQHRGQ